MPPSDSDLPSPASAASDPLAPRDSDHEPRTTRHAILVESRRAHAVTTSSSGRSAADGPADLRERSIALALHRLAPVEASQWLADRAGWPSFGDETGLHIVGDAALELAQILGRTDDLCHPLDEGDLSSAPQSSWSGMQVALERLLTDVRSDGFDLVAVVPNLDPGRRNLWLHAISDTLLAERFPAISTTDAGGAALPVTPSSGVDWGWWIGDFGTSVSTSYCGEVESSWLAGGTRTLLEKASTSGRFSPRPGQPVPPGSAAARALTIFARDFLARFVTQSIQMQRDLWWDSMKPSVSLRVVCPSEFVPIFESTTAGIVRDLSRASGVTVECVRATRALHDLVRAH